MWAMCAVDTLGIPLMTGQDAVITATDPHTGEAVRVEATGPTRTRHPPGTVVLLGRTAPAASPGPAAEASRCCTCPHINFHPDPGHAQAYPRARPDVDGPTLDQATAVQVARHAFRSTSTPGRRQGTLTPTGRQSTLTAVAVAVAVDVVDVRRVVEAATNPDPEVGLAAVAALRALTDVLEALQVDHARAAGWSWRDIAGRLGVTKQAVHAKHALRPRGR